MGFFKRLFQRRSATSYHDYHYVEESNGKQKKKIIHQKQRQQQQQQQQTNIYNNKGGRTTTSRAALPEARDDGVLDTRRSGTNKKLPYPSRANNFNSVNGVAPAYNGVARANNGVAPAYSTETGYRSTGTQDPDNYQYNTLSHISEEPTFMSSSTLGRHHETQTKPVAPPPAREAAFHGPPRFDWMDIEASAAVKIQSIYRRNKVMDTMNKQGVTTSAIRNRKRRRKASRGTPIASADVPSFLSCCAVGLAFGEATEEDDEAYREFQKKQYEERVKQQQMHEEAIRKQYLRSHGTDIGNVIERIEVVE